MKYNNKKFNFIRNVLQEKLSEQLKIIVTDLFVVNGLMNKAVNATRDISQLSGISVKGHVKSEPDCYICNVEFETDLIYRPTRSRENENKIHPAIPDINPITGNSKFTTNVHSEVISINFA